MSRNYELFPDDDNGNVLWQMYEDGNDLTDLHEIEFSIVFTTQEQADKCALHLLHEEQISWNVCCSQSWNVRHISPCELES